MKKKKLSANLVLIWTYLEQYLFQFRFLNNKAKAQYFSTLLAQSTKLSINELCVTINT